MNKIKSIATALILGIATTTFAQEENSTLFEQPGFMAKLAPVTNSTNLNVYIAKPTNNRLLLELKNIEGHLLYSNYIGKKRRQAFIKLKMEEMPDGIYTVEISDKASKSTKSYRKGIEVVVARPVETLVAIN